MNRMIDDILDLTRGQFGEGIPLTFAPADLGEVSRAAVSELRTAHPARLLEDEVAGDARGFWDEGRLARVVSNLVGNAIHYSAQGPVRVSVTGEGERVTLAVHNGGEPIPGEALPRIFDPFRRATSNAPGLGLGLYIVQEIVRAHGGTVGVASSRKEGTTFAVTLPRRPPAVEAPARREPAGRPRESALQAVR
jgi:signal transduction histidine kinase